MRARPLLFIALPVVCLLPFDLIDAIASTKSGGGEGPATADRISRLGGIVVGGYLLACFSFVTGEMAGGRRPTMLQIHTRAAALWTRVFGVNFFVGLWMVLGFLCLVLPGIYAAVCFSLAVPVAVLENLRAGDALRRSRSLVQQRGIASVFGHLFVFYALILGVTIVPALVVVFIGAMLDVPEHWASTLLLSLPSSVGVSMIGVATTLLYFDISGLRALRPVGTDLVSPEGSGDQGR